MKQKARIHKRIPHASRELNAVASSYAFVAAHAKRVQAGKRTRKKKSQPAQMATTANIQLESETTTTAAKLPRLPRIEHPFAKQRGVDSAATDSLRVRGLASRSNAARPSTGGALATAASTPNDRPATTTGLAELPSLHQKLPAVPEEEGVTAPQGAPIRAIGSRAFSRRIAVRPRTQGNQRGQMTADDVGLVCVFSNIAD